MIQLTFFLKYQAQLMRIRPGIYDKLKQLITDSIELYGGNVKLEHHAITALFDEESIGFWIDILCIIETLQKIINTAKKELYGHICILSEIIDDEQITSLLNTLPFVKITSGIWCTRFIQKNLDDFFEFKKPQTDDGVQQYAENIEELQNRKAPAKIRDVYALRKTIHEIFCKKNPGENTLFTGGDFAGKRGYLHWLYGVHNEKITPVTVRFGSWGAALNCFSDALSPQMRKFITSKNIKISKELDDLYDALFSERLNREYSEYTLKKAERFWELLLEAYSAAVSGEKPFGVIILENIQNAGSDMRNLVLNHRSFYKKNGIAVYAVSNVTELPEEWEDFFTSVINCPNCHESEDNAVSMEEVLNLSLLETAYACNILGRYFPAYMFRDLFSEEGKNPASLDRALDMLFKYGVIRSKQDPESEIHGFVQIAEKLLGKRALYIRGMAVRRLISWSEKCRIRPCFGLLEAIYGLGGEISPILALEAVRQDVISGTYLDIGRAVAENRFDDICGAERSPPLLYIYKALWVLIYGDETEIKNTFLKLHIPETKIPNYKAQILTINAFYKMGIHDTSTAFEEIKSAMIICQDKHRRYGSAQVYRMFAFINLSRNKLDHAIDYLTFAMEDSEHAQSNVELALSAYYAANAYFIHGNISKAHRLIKQAEHAANTSGMEEWVMRSRFISGRFYFETGCYKDALETFKSLYGHYSGDPVSNQAQVISAWIFRAETYLHGKAPEGGEFVFGDGLLFKAEAAYLSGEYEKAAEITERLIYEPPEEGFLFLEQPDWCSGFAQCELLQTSKRDLWVRIAAAWRAISLSMLDETKLEEASRLIQKIINDKYMREVDPNAPFYFFINYKILTRMNAAEADRNTAVSIAFKRLQRRSSRIDDIDIRRSFLSKHYWNKLLYLTARDHKLISGGGETAAGREQI
jgi:tetratricopeptide (TPR) repeat protein